MALWLKRRLIRTPLEAPLKRLRHLLQFPRRMRHPELREIFLEDGRIARLLRLAIREDSNCMDIGCHIGSMLSEFLRLAPRGRHAAFEADPKKARWLKRKFPEVEVRSCALSDRSGTATFHVDRREGFSSLAEVGGRTKERIQVSCATLDELAPADRRFDFLKIDVEGAELMVFRGAREFLSREAPLILFECGPAGPRAFGYQPGDLFDFVVEECSYRVFFLQDWLEKGEPASRESFEGALVYPFKAYNWVAEPAR